MARTKSDTFKRTVPYFDDEFRLQKAIVEGPVPSAATYQEAVALFGNDSAAILDALNAALREKAIRDAVANATKGMEEKHIMKFIKTFRQIPPHNGIENVDEQTKSILSFVRSIPELLTSLKEYCKAQSESAEEDEE